MATLLEEDDSTPAIEILSGTEEILVIAVEEVQIIAVAEGGTSTAPTPPVTGGGTGTSYDEYLQIIGAANLISTQAVLAQVVGFN